jgi:hypothetical protein
LQEEVNEKTIALSIRTTKMTASILKVAMRQFLAGAGKVKNKLTSDKPVSGKQTMKQLMKQNTQLTNIEVTDGNIRSFERIARKYYIDFSLKKDSATTPPRYIVFFKAKDVDVMTLAFKEYSDVQLKKNKRLSVRNRLENAQEVAKNNHDRERVKVKEKEQSPSL